MVLDELTTSEALMPFFLPNPGTTLEKLRLWQGLDLYGVIDWWGLHRQEAEGWHSDVNRQVVGAFRKHSHADDRALLADVASELYGSQAVDPAMAAWDDLKRALDGWAIFSWHQRMNWPVMMWQHAFYHRDLTVPPPRAERPPLPGSGGVQDNCPLEVWQALGRNLDGVIAGYTSALARYEQAAAAAEAGRGRQECSFHRDSVELGRCFHRLGRDTVEAQLARREERPVATAIMQAAIGNLVRIIELSDRLGTFEYRRDWYWDAIANPLPAQPPVDPVSYRSLKCLRRFSRGAILPHGESGNLKCRVGHRVEVRARRSRGHSWEWWRPAFAVPETRGRNVRWLRHLATKPRPEGLREIGEAPRGSPPSDYRRRIPPAVHRPRSRADRSGRPAHDVDTASNAPQEVAVGVRV